MELIKSAAHRSRLSDVIYISLNLLFAMSVYLLAVLFDPPYIAYAMVFLSKWRVFAVRPRFWFANVQANTVDVLVGLSAVTLIWMSDGAGEAQMLFGALYAAWLLLLKPRTQRHWVLIQAAVSQFFAITALLSLAYAWPVFAVTLVAWLIGYVAARHALGSYDEEELTLLSLVWGLVIAELVWLSYHWTIAYTLIADVKLPAAAIVVASLSFLAIKVYALARHQDKLSFRTIRWPFMFVGAVIVMLLLRFSGLDISEL